MAKERHERLRAARIAAGYERQRDAVERFGWNPNTYKSNENGNAPFSFDQGKTYAKAFGVRAEWLYDGSGPMASGKRTIQIVGYVGAGAAAHLYDAGQGPFDEVEAPDDASDSTVAVQIRGESLGALFDEWLVFYDDRREPVTTDLIGKLCVVGLADGRVLVKKLQKARERGLYHLLSNTEAPILDVPIEWAAEVKAMRPR